MKSFIIKSLFVFLGLSAMISLSSCLKDEFDTPPTNIAEIKEEQIISFDKLFEKLKVGSVTAIQDDVYLEALIVADDKSGNIYKNLILHDLRSEKGITMSIDENEMHALYPVGQVVFVSLKNLSLGYFEGLPSLGINESNKVGRLPASLLRSTLIKAGRTLPVVPKKVKVEDLDSDYYSTLIELEGMQFVSVSSTTTYADPNPEDPQSINHDVQNCTGGKLVLRNSGFADFAGLTIPSGNGTLVAVYSYYRSAAQLLIRDVNDLKFTGNRCDGSGGGPSGDKVTIENLRSQFSGTAKTLSSGYLQGIVISDITNKNINGQNIVVQDGDFGILCRFKSAVNIPLGTEVKVGLAGGSLSEFNNLLQVQNLENTSVEVVASGKSVTPKVLTVSQIDIAKHESTLIKIENASIIGGAKLSDNSIKVKDASGEIALFTFATSTFGAQTLPSGTVTVTAIVSDFTSGKQLSLRNSGDITGGGPCDVNVATADCDGDGVANGQDCAPQNAAIYPGGPCDDGNAATFNDQYDNQCVCKGGSSSAEFNNVEELRQLFNGNPKTINSGFVTGIVISDYTQKNINGHNLVLQDGGYGIVLRFKSPVTVALGTEIKVNLTGGSLSEFNKLLQVQDLPNANIETISTNNTVTPKVLKVSELSERYESTLVKIENATIIDGTKFSDKLKIKDSTGEVLHFTNATATFYNESVKSGSVSVTAIAGQFKDDLQLLVRSPNDIQ